MRQHHIYTKVKLKRLVVSSLGKNVEKGNPHAMLVRMKILQLPWNISHTFPTWPSDATPIPLPQRNENTGPLKYLNNNARNNSVIVTLNRKQFKCPWRGQWISKGWHIHAVEYYSVSKGRKTRLMHVKWILKRCWWKRAYTEDKVYGMIPLTRNSGKEQI